MCGGRRGVWAADCRRVASRKPLEASVSLFVCWEQSQRTLVAGWWAFHSSGPQYLI